MEQEKKSIVGMTNNINSIKFSKKFTLEEDLFMKIKPQILLKNHFRYISPYPYIYKSFVKQRWENRTVCDVFSKEFRSDTLEYYVFHEFFFVLFCCYN